MLSGTHHIITCFKRLNRSNILKTTLRVETLALNPPELTEYHPRHDRHKSTPAPGSSSQRYDNGFNSSERNNRPKGFLHQWLCKKSDSSNKFAHGNSMNNCSFAFVSTYPVVRWKMRQKLKRNFIQLFCTWMLQYVLTIMCR